jgi:hypothetical protein
VSSAASEECEAIDAVSDPAEEKYTVLIEVELGEKTADFSIS